MAKNEQKVMEFVEKELAADPKQSSTALFEKAKKVDSGVAKLSVRQFNARYPLQIKRKKSLASPSGRRRKTGGRKRRSDSRHEAMRKVFLRFASDLAAAEARKDLVTVLANVDDYVTDGMKAAGR
jgi:hypothetical protein